VGSDTPDSTFVNIHAVEDIKDNSWLYDSKGQPSGQLGFGGDSQWMYHEPSADSDFAYWAIEIGNVADQSFTGQKYSGSNESMLYMGAGNYTSLGYGGNLLDTQQLVQ
jgi:hypothetical protein